MVAFHDAGEKHARPSAPLVSESRAVLAFHARRWYYPDGDIDKVRFIQNPGVPGNLLEGRFPTFDSFKDWIENKDDEPHVSREEAIAFLSAHPPEEWVIGARLIFKMQVSPIIYKGYLLEKIDLLETPGNWKNVFDDENRELFVKEMEESKTPGITRV